MIQLADMFGRKNYANLLQIFLDMPTKGFTQKILHKKTKLAKLTIITGLNFLVKANLIFLNRVGRTNFYSLNNESAIMRQIKILNILFKVSVDIEKIAKKYDINIYLYGSCARGEYAEGSDIDLLIVGKIKRDQIIREMSNLSKKINWKIKTAIYSKLEWSKVARQDKPFYERVEKDKIKIA